MPPAGVSQISAVVQRRPWNWTFPQRSSGQGRCEAGEGRPPITCVIVPSAACSRASYRMTPLRRRALCGMHERASRSAGHLE